MTLQEIKQAVRDGKKVFHHSTVYEVINPIQCPHLIPENEQWLIRCVQNSSCIGLTHTDEVTMNGEEEEFFIG